MVTRQEVHEYLPFGVSANGCSGEYLVPHGEYALLASDALDAALSNSVPEAVAQPESTIVVDVVKPTLLKD